MSALLCVVIGGCRSEEGSEAAGHESTSAVDDTEHGASSSEDSGGSDGGGLPACEDVASRLDFDRMMEDLATLESIAAEHGGNRASGLPGFDASHAWVKGELEAAGYVVDETAVDFNFAMRVAPGTLGQTAPEAVSFTHGEDFLEFLFTIPGDLEAPLSAVDLDLGPGNQSTSACEPEDFAGFTPGHIALIQRGTCTFATKIAHAAAAGAVGAIVFNQGGVADPARTEVQTVALFPEGLGDFAPIPAVFASYELGAALAAETGVVVRMVTDTVAEVRQSRNLIVETAAGNPDEVVMFGAHLDSVPDGPGINDNGTGSIAVLALARLVADCAPQRKLRFGWWAAEEFGLWGSNAYVAGLPNDELGRLLLYANFDMVGSPNAAHFVYDGDGSRFGQAGPPGSALLEQFFHDDFASEDLALLETQFGGRSDYAAFFSAGVATGGLFTGAEGIKTGEQAELFGGEAGEPFDRCYHRHCDGVANIDTVAYQRMSRSMARALQTFGVQGAGLQAERAPSSREQVMAAVTDAHAQHRGCSHAWVSE